MEQSVYSSRSPGGSPPFKGCTMDTTYVRVDIMDVQHNTIQCAVHCRELGKMFARGSLHAQISGTEEFSG